MTYLLDTNVVSESERKKPDANVMAWLEAADESKLFISRITIGEIHAGAENLRDREPRRALKIDNWLAEVEASFGQRILSVTDTIVKRWGKLYAFNKNSPIDMLIAAAALEHDLTVVTRNTKHFVQSKVMLLNPWEG